MLVSMAIYLGHTTARRILESRFALAVEPVPHHVMREPEAGARAVRSTIRAAFDKDRLKTPQSSNFYCRPGEPLDLMVDGNHAVRKWAGAQCHSTSGRLPSGSFYQLSSGIYVASPALCLTQLAPSMSRINIIKLAMSFCGIYQLEGDEHRILYERAPLTTPSEIGDYLDLARGLPGVEKVRDTLRWVIPNSASPMETRMVLPLYLSRHLGGYGLPRPVMNKQVILNEETAKIAGQKVCYADALWEEEGRRPLDFEYQSAEIHDKCERYGADYARQLALQRQGYTVQFVTNMQLQDEFQLNELARLVSSHTGCWLPPKAYIWDDLRKRMNEEVQGAY